MVFLSLISGKKVAKIKSYSSKQFRAEVKKVAQEGTPDTDSNSVENKNISKKEKTSKKEADAIFWYCYFLFYYYYHYYCCYYYYYYYYYYYIDVVLSVYVSFMLR